MTIKLDATNLWAEWTAADQWHRENLAGLDEQLDRYRGLQRGRLSSLKVQNAIEPHEFEWVSRMLPEMAFDNPYCRVGSETEMGDLIAPALGDALNQISRDTYFRAEAILACLDFQFLPAVLRVEMEPNQAQGQVKGAGPGGTGYGVPMRPRSYRVSPMYARLDPCALNTEAAAWTGWQTIHDRQRLIEHAQANPEQGWDIEALKICGKDNGIDAVRGNNFATTVPTRDEIALVHMWVRDADMAEPLKGVPRKDWFKFHGALCTSAVGGSSDAKKNGDGRQVRKPRPFFGPECGPLYFGYAYPLFDKPGGQGPLRPIKGRVDAINRLVALENQRIEKHRRMTIIGRGSERQIALIKNGEEDGVYSLPGAESASIINAEFGGPTEAGQAMIAMHRAALAQTSSMSPASRGTVTGAGTASENILADRAQQQQSAFLKMQFNDLIRRVKAGEAWYLYHSNRVVQPLSKEFVEEMGIPPGVKMTPAGPVLEYPKFYGGERGGQTIEPDEFKLMQITVDISSTAWRSDEEQMRLVQLVNEDVLTTGPMVSDPRMQHVNWATVQKMKAKALNNPLFTKLYNLEAAAEIAQSQALMEQAQVQEKANNPAKLGTSVGQPSSSPQLAKPRAGAGGKPTGGQPPKTPAKPPGGARAPSKPAGSKPKPKPQTAGAR